MLDTSHIGGVIEFEAPPIQKETLSAFIKATRSEFVQGFPPTFPTIYRKAEFEWLDRIKADIRQLLHTDQEYEYKSPLKVGAPIVVRTKLVDIKERGGRRLTLTFLLLETEVVCDGVSAVSSKTSFVLRGGAAKI